MRVQLSLLLLVPCLLAACDQRPSPETDLGDRLDTLVEPLLGTERAAGVGIAVIENGEVVLERYIGEQAPGTSLSAGTVFNTASVAKTIAAETLIALHLAGEIDLDEPVAAYVQHPELSADPRYSTLTPRLLMSHRAGLLNWAFEYDDGKLAFDHDPDTRYSYSGAGVELAIRYAEAKTGEPFAALADRHVLRPLGINDIALGDIEPWMDGRLAQPMDTEGRYRAVTELNIRLAGESDEIGAADDLLVTVPSYAKLLTAIANGFGGAEAAALRATVITDLTGHPIYNCPKAEGLACPSAYGHGIGWQVMAYEDHTVIFHSGSDAGENAMAFISPETGDGAVIFVNGANGWFIMTRVMEALPFEDDFADYWRHLIVNVMGREMPPLAP